MTKYVTWTTVCPYKLGARIEEILGRKTGEENNQTRWKLCCPTLANRLYYADQQGLLY